MRQGGVREPVGAARLHASRRAAHHARAGPPARPAQGDRRALHESRRSRRVGRRLPPRRGRAVPGRDPQFVRPRVVGPARPRSRLARPLPRRPRPVLRRRPRSPQPRPRSAERLRARAFVDACREEQRKLLRLHVDGGNGSRPRRDSCGDGRRADQLRGLLVRHADRCPVRRPVPAAGPGHGARRGGRPGAFVRRHHARAGPELRRRSERVLRSLPSRREVRSRAAATRPPPTTISSRQIAAESEPATVDGEHRTLGPGELDIGVASALYAGTDGYDDLAAALAQAGGGNGSRMLALADEYTGRTTGGKYSNETAAFYATSCIDAPAPPSVAAVQQLATRGARCAPLRRVDRVARSAVHVLAGAAPRARSHRSTRRARRRSSSSARPAIRRRRTRGRRRWPAS